jgi:hypothetical protein
LSNSYAIFANILNYLDFRALDKKWIGISASDFISWPFRPSWRVISIPHGTIMKTLKCELPGPIQSSSEPKILFSGFQIASRAAPTADPLTPLARELLEGRSVELGTGPRKRRFRRSLAATGN